MSTTFIKKIISVFIIFLSVGLQNAQAESITGTWSFVSLYGSTPYNYDMTFHEQAGVITGDGGGGGWTITGTIVGNQVSWHEDYVGSDYYADRIGTISGDTMSGSWSNNSQNGTWTATRTSSGGGGGNTPGTKRTTAISLFCNRVGVNLETAQCSVTLADQGPPPRILPPGAVNFTASSGFSPTSASCVLQQVSFSPGVGACDVQFAIPSGFGIGIPFPINATYPGSDTFKESSTSHELIIAACIGTPGQVCPDSIGLSFKGIPQIVNNLLSMLATCGSGMLANSRLVLETTNRVSDFNALGGLGIGGNGGSCEISAALGLDLDQLIKDIPQIDLAALEQLYSNSPKKFKDAFLNYASQASLLENGYYQVLQQNQGAVDDIQKIVEKNLLNKDWTKVFSKYHGIGFLRNPALKANKNNSKQTSSLLRLTNETKVIKHNKQGVIKLKLNARMKKLLPFLKRAGISTIPMKIKIVVKQRGIKKKASVESSVDVIL